MSGGWIGKSGAPGGGVVPSGVFSLAEVNEAKARGAWPGLVFYDDFNRTTLGSDWTAVHLDGTGSVTLDGATVTVDSASTGDFYSTLDGGSMIYRLMTASSASEIIVKVVTTGIANWSRLLMARKSVAANAAFAAAHLSGSTGRITPIWRITDGANTTFNEQGSVAYVAASPLWIRATYDGTTVQFWTSSTGATGPWDSAGSVNVSGLTLWCLTDSQHGAAITYDDFYELFLP